MVSLHQLSFCPCHNRRIYLGAEGQAGSEVVRTLGDPTFGTASLCDLGYCLSARALWCAIRNIRNIKVMGFQVS